MWAGIIALVNKVLDFVLPWSKYLADKKSDSNKRKQQAQADIEKEVKNEGQESMDDYWNARSRRKRG